MSENIEHGGISIELEHIFPIIKKWLYSEKEIFLREIVSNACDAVTKLNRLISLGEAKDVTAPSKITVSLNADAKTLTVTDDGIGMAEDELRRYICQIALSGALDFIQKYEGEEDAAASGIIGHFGLGFYSSFMVSDKVDIVTRSYSGAPAVKWTCGDDGQFDIIPDYSSADEYIGEHGTAVIMHINEEGEEYLNAYKLKDVLNKYCAFMPVPIFFEDETAEKKDEDEEPTPVNDTNPLWLKNPSECTEDEYKDFYSKVFSDYREPLFHIHIKADYPLNFKGILYFPRITSEFESLEGQVKLYYNQVFVADNIKEVIPEYLLMLKGVLDCPELPLNVSRSYLQNSGYVSKISAHIAKKVADKLCGMFSSDREGYEAIWRDLKTFVEYGSMRDKKFFGRVKNAVLFEKCSGGYVTLEEYFGGTDADEGKEAKEKKVYYSTDKTAQSKYIHMLASQGIEVVLLDRLIDTQFINVIEAENEGVKFCRVDAEIADELRADGDRSELPGVAEVFGKAAGEKTKIEFDRFKDEGTPAILHVSEESRRFEDMMKMYSMGGDMPSMPTEETLTVNTASPLIVRLSDKCSSDPALAEKMAKQIYSLCLLSQRKLTSDELVQLLDGSFEILEML